MFAGPSLRFGVTTEQTRAINRTVSEPLYPYQSIVVEIPDVFSDEYGAVVNYAVIVATNPQDSHTQDTVLPGWKSYNDGGVIAYQPISNCSGDFFIAGSQCGGGNAKKKRSVNNTPRLFTVGTQDCLAISDEYCNGYLTPETAYYIKLRAFTTGGFSDTEYSVKIVTGNAMLCLAIFSLGRRGMGKSVKRTDLVEKTMSAIIVTFYRTKSV